MLGFFKKKNATEKEDKALAVEVADLTPEPAPLPEPEASPAPETESKQSWFERLQEGLGKTSRQLGEGITSIFTHRKLDEAALEELEELLIRADMGAKTAASIIADFARNKFDKEISPQEVKDELSSRISALLAPYAKPLVIDSAAKPHVILVVGVNGNGKTTTIGKLAHLLKSQGNRVMLAAADTFRAAAVEQLSVWATRTDCEIITGADQADPASVAYQAYEKAKASRADVLLVDTAGRLHNKANLMAELQKIIKVIRKLEPSAPHSVLLVLDATTGQNALAQVEAFKGMVDVSGLIVTKLDGTAKAGVVVALTDKFKLPVHAIGVGEGTLDLKDFTAEDFARNMLG